MILHLQKFLLELGNGYSFVARQKRLLIEEVDFFADLVFYNRLLRCFVIIEIKTHKITHQDLGQLQIYVNYYDRNEKLRYVQLWYENVFQRRLRKRACLVAETGLKKIYSNQKSRAG